MTRQRGLTTLVRRERRRVRPSRRGHRARRRVRPSRFWSGETCVACFASEWATCVACLGFGMLQIYKYAD